MRYSMFICRSLAERCRTHEPSIAFSCMVFSHLA